MMKYYARSKKNIAAGIIGGLDFQRRFQSAILADKTIISSFACSPIQAWSEMLAHKPNCLILELGINYSARDHIWTKEFLSQLRERFSSEVYVVVALLAPDKFFFAGDLLFKDNNSQDPSGLVDTFLAQAPSGFPNSAALEVQIAQTLSLLSHELDRRESGLPAVPALGTEDWVHSLADPISRELWMLWLPRYASYTDENPIITGPTGAGKTRLAKALHILSGRSGPFISMTPRDFSSSELIQAELFGAVAGAYTGAIDKWGLVKSAENGTLFIDELQSIDKDLQGKLITFIENKSYRRVGSAETIEANVRFVFATNRTIPAMVDNQTLRDDFAYRLERVQLNLPPLSQRRLDIPAGLAFALAKIRRQRPQLKPIYGLTSQAYRLLFGYSWPGNLRQLENTVAKLCERAEMSGLSIISEEIVYEVFDSKLDIIATNVSELISAAALKLAKSALETEIETVEDGIIALKNEARATALELADGDLAVAAELLGENRNVLDLFINARVAAEEIRARTKE